MKAVPQNMEHGLVHSFDVRTVLSDGYVQFASGRLTLAAMDEASTCPVSDS